MPSVHPFPASNSSPPINMPTSDFLPVHVSPGSQPVKRHRRASYYASRVKESLTTRVSKILCSIVLVLLLIFGIITFILWLSLRPHRPRFHIHEFSVPGLAQESGFENARIFFNVTARNSNQNIGVFYDSMEGAVYYKDQKIGSTPLLSGFYQPPKTTKIVAAELSGATLTVNSQRWMEFRNDRASGTVVFRLEIESIIRFKVSSWDSKHHRMYANCDALVGPDGLILPSAEDKRCPVYFS